MMHYDQDTFATFKAKAISSIDEIEVGRRYWTNGYPETFVVECVISQADAWRREGLDGSGCSDDVFAIYYKTARGSSDHMYSSDHNIGRSYNPWLIFANEEDAIACRSGLPITYSKCDWDEFDPES